MPTYAKYPPVPLGAGGGVISVNGQVGIVTLDTDDIPDTSTNAYVPLSTLGARQLLSTDDPVTTVISLQGMSYDPVTLGLILSHTADLDGSSGFPFQNQTNLSLVPSASSPNLSYNVHATQAILDPTNTGLDIGTTNRAVTLEFANILHQGTSDVGEIVFKENQFTLGNGTDPISVRGVSYSYGFGTVSNNVDIVGPVQGYGFQPTFSSGSTMSSSQYVSAFYDSTNASSATLPNYTSFAASPNISTLAASSNYTGLRVNPTIGTLPPNSGVLEISCSGNYVDNGLFYQGINVNPTIGLVNNNTQAVGINVTMDNVTTGTGVASSLVFQDITYTFIVIGDNNVYTLEYLPGGTAGSEVVSISGTDITIQIQSGVSTATQVKAAWDLSPAAGVINAVITGTASNPQVTAGPTNFTGGANPGSKLAAFLDGDVQITGSLGFGGALSVGQLSAFYSQPIVGALVSAHTLISEMTAPASATILGADILGVNTAALINVGASTTIAGGFLGLTAMGLPAVAFIGAGAFVERVAGGTFALSLSGGTGTIGTMALCRSTVIPDGTTTVSRLYGYEFDLPFGDPGTDTWGLYLRPDVPSWIQGSLLVGGAPGGGNDLPTNSSVGVEIDSTTKALLLSRMTTAQRNALTAVAGMLIFNTDTSSFEGYNGTIWVAL